MPYTGLSGRVVIVTGAARGIGAACCRRLIAEGCSVGAVDVDAKGLAALAAELGDRLLPIVADVGEEADNDRYVAETVARFGDVTLFVNNAGVLGPRVPIVDLDLDDVFAAYRINIIGVLLGLRAVLRRMIAQGQGGSIVNLSSVGALKTQPGSAIYGSGKRAVIGLANAAAAENGKYGIRVNSVCPGPIDTPMLAPALGGAKDRANLFAGQPIGRPGSPDEAAAFIAYLLSDDASYQTAGVYTVDGGMTV